jgi:leucyl-tRNA synthetase
MYARFFTKVIHDMGLINFDEPFHALFTQGMICKRSEKDGQLYKMSKSKGNVVNPDELILKYGADTVRLYTLFIGPPEKDAEWNDQGIEGASRFLRRLWRRVFDNREILISARDITCDVSNMQTEERDLYRKVNETIDRVTRDMEGAFHFNSAIAQIMELTNAMDDCGVAPDSSNQRKAVYLAAMETVLKLLSPFAPHVAEELWETLGREPSILRTTWPTVAADALARDEIQIVIQVNGKVRGRIMVPTGIDDKTLETQVLSEAQIEKYIKDKTIRKVIVVPGKLVNIAVSG